MSQQERAALWRELKDAGVEFPQHYRDYDVETLRKAVAELRASQEKQPVQTPAEVTPAPLPIKHAAPDEHAGLRTNTKDADEPLRTDENGLIWYQDEVLKSAFPRPRLRRVLDYTDSGTKTTTVKGADGFTESFEVPGEQRVAAQVKVTLPTYQVGIYKDPRFPFKIHTYNGRRGFDLFEVQDYFGGPDLVPEAVQRIYVSSTLCYDMRTTIREIQQLARQLGVLRGIN